MFPLTKQRVFAVCAALTLAPAVNADEIIFLQDFETDLAWSPVEGSAAAQVTQPYNGQTTGGEGGERYSFTHGSGVKETIFTDYSTASPVSSSPTNFSVTTRNWDIHDGSQNGRVSGYRNNDGTLPNPGPGTNQTAENLNMQGNMLGHVLSGTSLPDEFEDNFYQIGNLALGTQFDSLKLSFDFDAFIWPDGDGFGVGVSTDGVNYALLMPTASSAMQYTSDLDTYGDGTDSDNYAGDLRSWIGADANGNQVGYNGGGVHNAGTAMFDLSGFEGQTVSLRFAFTTNGLNSGSGDGINIDNIKITGACPPGTGGANCNPPGGGEVPEPAALGLALLGLTFAWRRRLART